MSSKTDGVSQESQRMCLQMNWQIFIYYKRVELDFQQICHTCFVYEHSQAHLRSLSRRRTNVRTSPLKISKEHRNMESGRNSACEFPRTLQEERKSNPGTLIAIKQQLLSHSSRSLPKSHTLLPIWRRKCTNLPIGVDLVPLSIIQDIFHANFLTMKLKPVQRNVDKYDFQTTVYK